MSQDEIITIESLKSIIKDFFGGQIELKRIIVPQLNFSRSSLGSVFIDQKDRLYAIIISQPKLSLGEIKKKLFSANLVYKRFLAPNNDPDFFNNLATEKFKQVYPGLEPKTERDLFYYKSLIKYDPVLVEIKTVKNDLIQTFDSNAKNNWRPCRRFSYNQIKLGDNDGSI